MTLFNGKSGDVMESQIDTVVLSRLLMGGYWACLRVLSATKNRSEVVVVGGMRFFKKES